MIISAHPDDEVLGAGGTILKHKYSGHDITWLIATGISEEQGYAKQVVEKRQAEIQEAAHLLGVRRTYTLNFSTTSLTDGSIPALIEGIADVFRQEEPEIIYSVNRSDAHSDHRILAQALFSCTKSFRYPFVKQVLMYECISETEFAPALHENVFVPNYFVDISQHIDEKLEAMKIYASEVGDHPFPRSLENIKALAHFRGATAGVDYAEAFQLVKFIDK